MALFKLNKIDIKQLIVVEIHLQEAKRWHCGEFRVYADNENGEDVASIEVTVTCKYLCLIQL